MERERLEEILREFTEAINGCGDVEYVLINQVRYAIADYIAAIDRCGKGETRKGYQHKELRP